MKTAEAPLVAAEKKKSSLDWGFCRFFFEKNLEDSKERGNFVILKGMRNERYGDFECTEPTSEGCGDIAAEVG